MSDFDPGQYVRANPEQPVDWAVLDQNEAQYRRADQAAQQNRIQADEHYRMEQRRLRDLEGNRRIDERGKAYGDIFKDQPLEARLYAQGQIENDRILAEREFAEQERKRDGHIADFESSQTHEEVLENALKFGESGQDLVPGPGDDRQLALPSVGSSAPSESGPHAYPVGLNPTVPVDYVPGESEPVDFAHDWRNPGGPVDSGGDPEHFPLNPLHNGAGLAVSRNPADYARLKASTRPYLPRDGMTRGGYGDYLSLDAITHDERAGIVSDKRYIESFMDVMRNPRRDVRSQVEEARVRIAKERYADATKKIMALRINNPRVVGYTNNMLADVLGLEREHPSEIGPPAPPPDGSVGAPADYVESQRLVPEEAAVIVADAAKSSPDIGLQISDAGGTYHVRDRRTGRQIGATRSWEEVNQEARGVRQGLADRMRGAASTPENKKELDSILDAYVEGGVDNSGVLGTLLDVYKQRNDTAGKLEYARLYGAQANRGEMTISEQMRAEKEKTDRKIQLSKDSSEQMYKVVGGNSSGWERATMRYHGLQNTLSSIGDGSNVDSLQWQRVFREMLKSSEGGKGLTDADYQAYTDGLSVRNRAAIFAMKWGATYEQDNSEATLKWSPDAAGFPPEMRAEITGILTESLAVERMMRERRAAAGVEGILNVYRSYGLSPQDADADIDSNLIQKFGPIEGGEYVAARHDPTIFTLIPRAFGVDSKNYGAQGSDKPAEKGAFEQGQDRRKAARRAAFATHTEGAEAEAATPGQQQPAPRVIQRGPGRPIERKTVGELNVETLPPNPVNGGR